MIKTSIDRNIELRVADEVWIATALLHREQPGRADFTVNEILERAEKEAKGRELRPGVRVHASMHCVANRPPNPGRYRMLYATGKLTRRLFRAGDTFHPDRDGGKVVPRKEEIPPEYHNLLRWYEDEYMPKASRRADMDALLALRGSGRKLWADEHADEYVRRLREGWE
jgi:hypothetical protein